MIRYNKLFALLQSRGMKKTDLLEVISAPTLAKLSKGEVVKTDIVEKICKFLDCQPGDIMDYFDEEKLKEKAKELDEKGQEAYQMLLSQGYTNDQLKVMLQDVVNEYMQKVFAGGNPISDAVSEIFQQRDNGEIKEE